jgi:hypothetical protein
MITLDQLNQIYDHQIPEYIIGIHEDGLMIEYEDIFDQKDIAIITEADVNIYLEYDYQDKSNPAVIGRIVGNPDKVKEIALECHKIFNEVKK